MSQSEFFTHSVALRRPHCLLPPPSVCASFWARCGYKANRQQSATATPVWNMDASLFVTPREYGPGP